MLIFFVFTLFIPSLSYAYLNFDLPGPRTIGCSFDVFPGYSFVLVLSDLLMGHVIGRVFVRSVSRSLFHLISGQVLDALEVLLDTQLIKD